MKMIFAILLALPLLTIAQPAAPTDADLLNFALNLEYLEGEFYQCAAYGHGLPDNLRGGGPPSTGCIKASLDAAGQQYANELATDEMNHVAYLRSALGSAAVPMPQIDIGGAFAAAANAAAGATLSPPFSPYANDLFFYHGSFIFEDVGVTAYKGAAPLISNNMYISPLAGILAVEAAHASSLRTLLIQQASTELPYNVTVAEFIEAIANLRDSVDGPQVDDAGLFTSGGGTILIPTDSNSIAFSRTPQEVLSIVYLGMPLTNGGGFFPNGVNGYFSPSSLAG